MCSLMFVIRINLTSDSNKYFGKKACDQRGLYASYLVEQTVRIRLATAFEVCRWFCSSRATVVYGYVLVTLPEDILVLNFDTRSRSVWKAIRS